MTTTAPQAAHQRVAASRVPAATRAFLAVLFAVYVVLLAWAVLWKLDVPWVGVDAQRVIKLVPFVRFAEAGASAPFEVFANILFFVPFGIYLRLLVPSWPWWRAAGAIAAASLSLEIAQYVLAIGSTTSPTSSRTRPEVSSGSSCSPWLAGCSRRGQRSS